jgi:uncharacterized protein (DUF1800 family)
LADELAQLKRVENALGAGDTRRALDELDRYDRASKGQRMRAELARRFVEQNPESPLVDRARSFVAKDPGAAGGQPREERGVDHDTE